MIYLGAGWQQALQGPKIQGSVGFSEAEVIGSCESLDVGSRNWLGSSAETVSTFNCWVIISLALNSFLMFKGKVHVNHGTTLCKRVHFRHYQPIKTSGGEVHRDEGQENLSSSWTIPLANLPMPPLQPPGRSRLLTYCIVFRNPALPSKLRKGQRHLELKGTKWGQSFPKWFSNPLTFSHAELITWDLSPAF